MGGTRGPWPGLVGRRGPPAPGQGPGPCWLPGAGGPSKAWPRSVPGTASPRPGPTERQTAWMYNQRPRRHVLFPGVTLRPDVYGEKGLDISYNVSDNRTWTGLTQALHHFLAGRVQNALQCLHSFLVSGTPWGAGGRGGPQLGQGRRCACPPGYSPTAQEANINCTAERYFFQESFLAPNHTKFSCKFTADMLQNCSGRPDPTFGFEEGKPCFIIKMNRVSEGIGGEKGTGAPPLLHVCWPRARLPSDQLGAAMQTHHPLDRGVRHPPSRRAWGSPVCTAAGRSRAAVSAGRAPGNRLRTGAEGG